MTRRWTVTVPLPEANYLPRDLPAERLRGVMATITLFPIPYVIVLVSHDGFFDPVTPTQEQVWEDVRTSLAISVGIQPSQMIPKLALVAAGPGSALFRTRKGLGQGWHDGAAGSGLLAFAAAAIPLGTVPNLVAGNRCAHRWTVITPVGSRSVSLATTPDGRPGLALPITTSSPVTL